MKEVILKLVSWIIGYFLLAFVVCWLWNAIITDIFTLPEIGYWQALGLSVLCRFVFGDRDFDTND